MAKENLEQRITSITNDREHGSRWLVRQTILLLRDLATQSTLSPAERLRQVRYAGYELAHARPAMAALSGAVGRILSASGDLDDIAQAASHLLQAYDTSIKHITTYARPLLTGTIMTHSLSGTVLEVLTACLSAIEQVIVLEGRPRYEGREVARALSSHHARVMLITDAQAALFLPLCHAVVVGADSILASGDVLNKAGTALLAWAAHGHHVPFYVLSETLKISPHIWSGDLAQLEEKEAAEVLAQPIAGVSVRNFYFDCTPAHLITKIITEQGALSKQEIQRQAAQVEDIPREN